ncbi:MAG: hypothetical protein Q9213_006472 [Squamulea squamosa]
MLLRWLLLLLAVFLTTIQATPLGKSRKRAEDTSSDDEYYDTHYEFSDEDEHLMISQENDDETCVDYSTCAPKGLGYWNKLQTTLFSANPVDRTDGHEIFRTYYGAKFDGVTKADPDFRQGLLDRGIQDYKHFDLYYSYSIDPATGGPSKEMAYMTAFDTLNGIMIVEGAWREMDQQKKLQWSEVMYQTWQVAKANADHLATTSKDHPVGGPISNLRGVIQHLIVNKGTQKVLRAAYNANGYSIGHGDTTWQKWTEEDQHDFFFGLLGTDTCKGTVYLLNDHAVEIGRKEPTVIWTRWTEGSSDIWIDITPLPE